ncbi:3-hydroxybutyrate dehydrogenase [Diaporthe sp. PMI_573]|nr:3-hydroxybutyrate dehydrogenase [Diaporthaceae sp. PMI_573]
MAQIVRGKTAIVTGAGSGICLAFARRLLKRGSNVVLADTRLRPEAADLITEYEGNAHYIKTDVTSWSNLERLFDVSISRFGSVDIVCPGAGVFEPPQSSFWSPPGSEESFDKPLGDRYMNIDVNLVHPIRMTQLAISYFRRGPSPAGPHNPKSVVLVASVASETASLQFPLYHAAKHGLFGFAKSMASLESQLGIRVTAVLPGMVKTPMWTEAKEKMQSLDTVDENEVEWISPQDVAKAMLACVEENTTESLADIGAVEERIEGGTCLEIMPGSVRDVPIINNVGRVSGSISACS